MEDVRLFSAPILCRRTVTDVSCRQRTSFLISAAATPRAADIIWRAMRRQALPPQLESWIPARMHLGSPEQKLVLAFLIFQDGLLEIVVGTAA